MKSIISKDGKTIHRLDKNYNGDYFVDANVETISNRAFANCKGLTGVTLPETLKAIGEEAFSGCENLRKKVIIPEGVEVIPRECFSGCTGLTEVELPRGVKQIANGAFYQCPLEKINLEEVLGSLELIGKNAFRGHKFEIPDLPETVKVNDRAFK